MAVAPNMVRCACAILVASLEVVSRAGAQTVPGAAPLDRAALARQVKAEYLRAWEGYKRTAWGYDEVRPVSGTPRNWYRESMLVTPIDALDGLVLMGCSAEAESLCAYISANARWDRDMEVQCFEVIIRCVGGLVASYELTGDRALLASAEDLARRMLPAFTTPTGMPMRFVNLRTGASRGEISNPAEVGSCILEFGTLTRHTGDSLFLRTAKRALRELFRRRSALGLVGAGINVVTGEWTDRSASVGCCIDSYYEYLYKGWLLFGDPELKEMWETHRAAVNTHIARECAAGLYYPRVDMDTGELLSPTLGALDAYFPAVLAASGDLSRARSMQAACYAMWRVHGIEPEFMDMQTREIPPGQEQYALRPEIVESCYYLYHFTRDEAYLRMGSAMWADLQRYCRTDIGYTELASVVTKKQGDLMHSFLLGETLKYFYLLFTTDPPLAFDEVVFTTEAHPLRRSR